MKEINYGGANDFHCPTSLGAPRPELGLRRFEASGFRNHPSGTPESHFTGPATVKKNMTRPLGPHDSDLPICHPSLTPQGVPQRRPRRRSPPLSHGLGHPVTGSEPKEEGPVAPTRSGALEPLGRTASTRHDTPRQASRGRATWQGWPRLRDLDEGRVRLAGRAQRQTWGGAGRAQRHNPVFGGAKRRSLF